MTVTKCFDRHIDKANDLTPIFACIRAYSRRGHGRNFIKKEEILAQNK